MLQVHPETGNRRICMRPQHFRPDRAEGNRDEGDDQGDWGVEDEREILKINLNLNKKIQLFLGHVVILSVF